MKTTEQCFPLVLFFMPYTVFLTLQSERNSEVWLVLSCGSAHYAVQRVLPWIKSLSVTFQMKAAEQYFPVVLFIVLHKVILAAIFGWNSSSLHSFYIHTFYGAFFFFTLQNVFLLSSSFVAEHSRQSNKAVPLWSIVSLLYFRCSCPKFWVYEFKPKAVVNNTN